MDVKLSLGLNLLKLSGHDHSSLIPQIFCSQFVGFESLACVTVLSALSFKSDSSQAFNLSHLSEKAKILSMSPEGYVEIKWKGKKINHPMPH